MVGQRKRSSSTLVTSKQQQKAVKLSAVEDAREQLVLARKRLEEAVVQETANDFAAVLQTADVKRKKQEIDLAFRHVSSCVIHPFAAPALFTVTFCPPGGAQPIRIAWSRKQSDFFATNRFFRGEDMEPLGKMDPELHVERYARFMLFELLRELHARLSKHDLALVPLEDIRNELIQ